jgi:hypothetical protein
MTHNDSFIVQGFFMGIIFVGIIASVIYVLHHNKMGVGLSKESVKYLLFIVGFILLGCILIAF